VYTSTYWILTKKNGEKRTSGKKNFTIFYYSDNYIISKADRVLQSSSKEKIGLSDAVVT